MCSLSGLGHAFAGLNGTVSSNPGSYSIQSMSSQGKNKKTLMSISVTPGKTPITVGDELQLTATGTYSDGSTTDLTNIAVWSSGSDSVASVSDDGTAMGLSVGTTNLSAALAGITGDATVKVNPPTGDGEVVPSTFFGNQKAGMGNPWYTVPVGASRLYAYEDLLWGFVETADGVYDWTVVDDAVDEAVAHGVDLIYTFADVPVWLSSHATDSACNPEKGPGSCDPPNDLCTDLPACTNALGTDKHFKVFIKALMHHVTAGGNKVSDVVQFYETWAEFNVYSEWAGNDAQMLRMQQDLYSTVKSINSDDLVLSPSSTGDNSANRLLSYLTQQGPNYPALPVTDILAFHGYCDNGSSTDRLPSPECIAPILQTLNAGTVGTGFDLLPVWNTESSWGSQLSDVFTDGEERAGFVVRSYLLAWANGVQRMYWWAWDQENSGRLWDQTSEDECTTPDSAGGYICTTGTAYGTVYNWMVGHTMTQPCYATGNIWTCGMDEGLIVWDASKTCSPCNFSNYTIPDGFTHETDVYGNVTDIKGSSVKIGYKPVLLN